MACALSAQRLWLITMDGRWGFEEDDEWVDDVPHDEPADDAELITGQDADQVVTVSVDDAGAIARVALADDWQGRVAPQALGSAVLTAANAAVVRATAAQAERIDLSGDDSAESAAPGSTPSPEETPLSREDAFRLLDEMSADLERFMERAAPVIDQDVSVRSGGGHVAITGRQRQVHQVEIDQSWAGVVRSSEVESELRDALVAFSERSDPGELAAGPQSSAISEIRALVADPQALIRRIRMARH